MGAEAGEDPATFRVFEVALSLECPEVLRHAVGTLKAEVLLDRHVGGGLSMRVVVLREVVQEGLLLRGRLAAHRFLAALCIVWL